MYKIHKAALEIRTADGSGWENYCIKLPVAKVDLGSERVQRRRKREEVSDDEEDLFADFNMNFPDEGFG